MGHLLTLFASPRVASLVLPAGALAIYSVVKTPTWTGNCCRIKRASDSTQTDIGFTASGYMNTAAALAFAAGSLITVETWYDQSGNAYDAVAVVAQEPKIISGNTIKAVQPITFMDSAGNSLAGMTIPAGLAADTRSFTMAQAVSVGGGWSPSVSKGLGALGATINLRMRTNNGVYDNTAGTNFSAGDKNLYSGKHGQVDSVIYGGSATNTYLNVNGNAATSLVLASAATAGGYIGANTVNTATNIEMFAFVVYGTNLSAGDKTSIDTAFKSAFNAKQTYTSKIVYDGDSITGAVQYCTNTYCMGYPRIVTGINGHGAEVNNLGIPGQTMSTIYTNRANATVRYNSAYAKNVSSIFAGTNDMAQRATGTIVGFGTTIWTSYLLPYIQAMQAASFSRVVVGTMLPRAWLGSAQDIIDREAERLVYNQLIRDNAATYSYTVLDYAGISAMATYSDTTYYVDGIHPTRLGHNVMGAYAAPLILPYTT